MRKWRKPVVVVGARRCCCCWSSFRCSSGSKQALEGQTACALNLTSGERAAATEHFPIKRGRVSLEGVGCSLLFFRRMALRAKQLKPIGIWSKELFAEQLLWYCSFWSESWGQNPGPQFSSSGGLYNVDPSDL